MALRPAGSARAARVEPVHAVRRRLPALVRGSARDLRRRPALGADLEGYPLPAAGWRDRGLDRLRVATAPMFWLQFGAVPLLTVPANALAAPVVAPLLGLALAATALAPVSPSARSGARLAQRLVRGIPRRLRPRRRRPAGRPGPLRARRGGAGRRCAPGAAYARRRWQRARARLPPGRHRRAEDPRGVHRLRAHIGEDDIEQLSCSRDDRRRRGRRLQRARPVRHRDAARARRGRRWAAAEQRWKVADAKAMAEYLENPAPDTVLALVGEESQKDSPLAKAVVAAQGDLCVRRPQARPGRWVPGPVASWAPRSARRLPRARRHRRRDLTSSRARSTSSPRGRAASRSASGRRGARRATADAPVFALTDAWGRRDVGAALDASESLLERSVRRHDRPSRPSSPTTSRASAPCALAVDGLAARAIAAGAEDASPCGREGVRAGAQLRRGAARRARAARCRRRRAQGRQPAVRGARAGARAGRDDAQDFAADFLRAAGFLASAPRPRQRCR